MRATILAVLTLLAATASAQVAPYLRLEAADLRDSGYDFPAFSAGVGVEALTGRTLTLAGATYSPTNKNSVNDGYSVTGKAELFLRGGPMLLGGGLNESMTVNSVWRKQASGVRAGVGYRADGWRMMLLYGWPLHDPNRVSEVVLDSRFALARHVAFGTEAYAFTAVDQQLRKFHGVDVVVYVDVHK